jgi:hypothetical protein
MKKLRSKFPNYSFENDNELILQILLQMIRIMVTSFLRINE